MKNFTDRKRDGIPCIIVFPFISKVIMPDGCFSRFLNCTNGIKSHNASQKINSRW